VGSKRGGLTLIVCILMRHLNYYISIDSIILDTMMGLMVFLTTMVVLNK